MNRKRSTSLSASSQITFARFRSPSLTESSHQTKVAVTFCGAFCVVQFATDARSRFTSRFSSSSWTSWRKTWVTSSPKSASEPARIRETIRREEEAFNKTLDKGVRRFSKQLSMPCRRWAKRTLMSGLPRERNIFLWSSPQDLHSNFTIPTAFRLISPNSWRASTGSRSMSPDFEKLMEQQRERARKAQKKEEISVEEDELNSRADKIPGIRFS